MFVFLRTIIQFLDTFAKLQKMTVTFIMSVCPHGTTRLPLAYFHEILYLSIFWKSVEKIQVSLKSVKNNRYFTCRPVYIYDHISLSSLYNEKCFRQMLRKSNNTFYVQKLFFKNRVIYYIMWKNTVEPARPPLTIWHIVVVCFVTKATDTHMVCNTNCFFTTTVVSWTHLRVMLYVYCLSWIPIYQSLVPFLHFLVFAFSLFWVREVHSYWEVLGKI
jgi:hypothetical protein